MWSLITSFWLRSKYCLRQSLLRCMGVVVADLQAQLDQLASQVQLVLQVQQVQLEQLGLPDLQAQQAEQARLELQVQRDQLALRVQQARRG